MKPIIYFFFIIFIFTSCNKSSTLFEKLPNSVTNINFRNDLKENDLFNLIEYLYFYNGGGVATGDINNDGLIDIYFSSNQGSNKLYLNKGNFQFKDITYDAGVESINEWKTGVTLVDVNGDGFIDIYQNRLGGYKDIQGRNQLFINNGDLTFTEKARDYGIDFEGFSTHSAFFDYDGDGDLDLYLLNHSVHTERSYGNYKLRFERSEKSGDKLFRNDIDKGLTYFTDVSEESGILSSNIGYGLGVAISDINRDGCDDIYISNDFRENDYLYLNNCDGTFTESLESFLNHTSRFSMCNDIGDINNDQYPDIFVLDMLPDDEEILKRSAGEDSYEIYEMKLGFGFNKQFSRNTLQLNNKNNSFSEISQLSNIHATDWSWSTLIEDFDLDSRNDIHITNGIVKRPNDMDYINFISNENLGGGLSQNPNLNNKQLLDQMPDGKVRNYAYRNLGDLDFDDVSEEWGLNYLGYSNGSTYDDFDNDGDFDLVVNNINDNSILYRNKANESRIGNFLKINFNGSNNNLFGIGAKVLLWYKKNSAYKENFLNRGFMSSKSSGLIFGLGNSKSVDSLMVIWPSRKTQKIYNIDANTVLTLIEKDAENDYENLKEENIIFKIKKNNGIKFTHKENIFNDFNRERLLPFMISREGPAISVSDINSDGNNDIFFGSASFSKSELYLGTDDGNYILKKNDFFDSDFLAEDVDAIFFDADGDADLDLYVVSAGNEFPSTAKSIRDRLYIWENKNYVKKDNLPDIGQHGSVVTSYDYDNDGDNDLFIGGRVISGKYGYSPKSYFLNNNGKGIFSVDSVNSFSNDYGMITDAIWDDIDNDGLKDLITCGDWSGINIYKNRDGIISKDTSFIGSQLKGLWFSIHLVDLNNDGKKDIIAGNFGENNKLNVDRYNPLKMYFGDFDDNNSIEQIITFKKNGKEFSISNKDELSKQLNYISKKFVSYKEFAGLEVNEIFTDEILKKNNLLEVNELRSLVLMSDSTKYRVSILPKISQISPIKDIQHLDFNNDSNYDLMIFGNMTKVAPYFGSLDSNYGILLRGDGEGNLSYVDQSKSGLKIRGDVSKVLPLDKNRSKFVIGINDKNISIISSND